MRSILVDTLEALSDYSSWIPWNLFLAFIPLILSFWLFFGHRKKIFLLWWISLIVFIVFLPNAPYLLTDIIHLVEAIRAGYSIWMTTLVFIPVHLLAILIGWEAYVISVINQSNYLNKQGGARFIFISELVTHALCAIGIFLGRFDRFNSWDFVTQPDVLFTSIIADLTNQKTLLIIVITFLIITTLYWLTKQITLGTALRIKQLTYSLSNKRVKRAMNNRLR